MFGQEKLVQVVLRWRSQGRLSGILGGRLGLEPLGGDVHGRVDPQEVKTAGW